MGEVGKVGAGPLPCWVLGSAETEGLGEWEGQALGRGEWDLAQGGSSGPYPGLCRDCEMGAPGDFYDRRLLPRLVLGVRGRGAVEIPKGHGCTDPWLPNNKQHTGSRGSLRTGGSSQGHSPAVLWRPGPRSLDPGLLTPLWSLRRSWWPSWGGRRAGPGPEPGLLFAPSLASLTGPGRPRPPPSGALFFPHLCSSHPLHSCLSLPLDHHLIFLFPQPLAQGSGQCVLKNSCQRSEDTCPPTCGKEAGVCPAQQPRCEAVSSVRPCCKML